MLEIILASYLISGFILLVIMVIFNDLWVDQGDYVFFKNFLYSFIVIASWPSILGLAWVEK